MTRFIKITGITLFFILALFSFNFAQEESFTITTYYPSPYGSYNELKTYSNTYLATDSGNVGIGTTNPEAKLDIIGNVRWSGTLESGAMPWAQLDSFPAECPAGQFVTAVGSTLTCAEPPHGELVLAAAANTNWGAPYEWATFASFSIPAEAQSWTCSYGDELVIGGLGQSVCNIAQLRVVCNGITVYQTSFFGLGWHIWNLPISTSSGVNCNVQGRSGCPPPGPYALFGHITEFCYYVR